MSVLELLERHEAERQYARDRLAEARQISDDPRRWSIGPEPCAHPKDALGSCIGPCDGEGWDR